MDEHKNILSELDEMFYIWKKTIDSFLEAEIEGAERAKDNTRKTALQDIRLVNDRAYFCLYFFKIEAFLKTAFKIFCEKKTAGASGVDLAAWKCLSNENDLHRIINILLYDHESSRRTLNKLYGFRNAIAHGGKPEPKPEMNVIPAQLEDAAEHILNALTTLEATP